MREESSLRMNPWCHRFKLSSERIYEGGDSPHSTFGKGELEMIPSNPGLVTGEKSPVEKIIMINKS